MEIQFFTSQIIHWYENNKRDLPWRGTKNPYLIWLSEIILQQTRVAQGLPYYLRYAENYPDVVSMANAPEDDFMRIWQGLGYYSRARNMYATAKIVAEKGSFPNNFLDLKELKGIGDYTAAAIASFAFDEDVAVLDGNVFRVLSRFFGVEDDIASHQGKKVFTTLANEILPKGFSAIYNQAIMEFGALHCKPMQPLCQNCPLAISCIAFKEKKQATLPVKSKKIKVKERYLNYFLIQKEGKLYLNKRVKGDIWEGLYDLPLIETTINTDWQEIKSQNPDLISDFDCLKQYPTIKHILTHQKLYINFFLLHANQTCNANLLLKDASLFDFKQIEALPKPIVVSNFLKKILENI